MGIEQLQSITKVGHLSSAFTFTSAPSVFMAASSRVSPFLGVQLYRSITSSSYLVRLTLSNQLPNKVMVMDRTVSPPPKKKKVYTLQP